MNREQVVVEKIGERSETFDDMLALLPKDDFRYIVIDYAYETDEVPPRKQEKLISIHWCPQDLAVKRKVISATGREKLKSVLDGVTKDFQADMLSDVSDTSSLIF